MQYEKLFKALGTVTNEKNPSQVIDGAVGKVSRIAYSTKEEDKARLEALLVLNDFYDAPTVRKLFLIVGNFVEHEERNKMRGANIPGGYDYDTAAFAMYYDNTSSHGHVVNLTDLGMTKREKDRAMKLAANPEFNVPPFPKLSLKTSPKEIEQIIQTLGMEVITKPLKINALISAENGKVVYNLNWLATGQGYDVLKEVPLWKYRVSNEVAVATYYPLYKSHKADIALLHAVKSFLTLHPNSERTPFIYESGAKLREIMTTHQFSNGSVEGQMGRYKQVLNQSRRCAAMRGNAAYRNLTTDFRQVMKDRYPILDSGVSLLHGPLKILNDWNLANQGGLKYPPLIINRSADAGLLYARGYAVITREKSMYGDVDTAQWLYDLFGATRAVNEKERQRALTKAHKTTNVAPKTAPWLYTDTEIATMVAPSRLCKLKPKADIYNAQEIKNKVRNFSVHNAGFSNMAMIFFSQVTRGAPMWHEHSTSWNMVGWSPYYGGMTKIMKLVLDEKSAVWSTRNGSPYMKPLVYADNFWCVAKRGGEKRWYSMDGIKAEAHVTAADCKQLVHHFASGYAKISATWMRYMLTWYPVLCVNSIGVLATQQLACEFLGSGSPGTAYLNTVATIDYVTQLEKLTTKDWTEWTDRDTEEVKVGNWQAAEAASARMYKCEMSVSLEEIQTSTNEVRIDLLGYSCIPGFNFGMPGHWIPILDSPRLYKAMSFLKTDLVSGEELSIVTQAVNFFRYRVFYALGGWYDPGLSELLVIRCGTLKKQMGDVPTHIPLTDALEGIVQSLSLSQIPGSEGLLTFGSSISIPTMFDVFSLTCGPQAADSFVDWAFDHAVGKPWTYMPYTLFIVEADKRNYTERPLRVAYGKDLGGGLEEKTMEADLYDIIVRSKPNPWGFKTQEALVNWEEEDPTAEIRLEHERHSDQHTGQDFPLISVEKPTVSKLKPIIDVQGTWNLVPPEKRKVLGTNLKPILIMHLRNYPLKVEDPMVEEQLQKLMHRISTFMSTPLTIVKAAMNGREVLPGKTVDIKSKIRTSYMNSVEFVSMQDEIAQAYSQTSVPL